MPPKRTRSVNTHIARKRQRDKPAGDRARPGSYWTRTPERRWLLDGETDDSLKGPVWTAVPDVRSKPLSEEINGSVRAINEVIKGTWDNEYHEHQILWLVNGHAFYRQLFRARLVDKAHGCEDRKMKEKLNQYRDKLDASLKDKKPTNSDLDRVLFMFASQKGLKPSCRKALAEARFKRGELRDARGSGRRCHRLAKWIGIERADEKIVKTWAQEKYLMVESESQARAGLKSGAFKEGEYVRADQEMNRVCAPGDEEAMHSFIFWTKESPEDNQPTWDKVFGGLVYGLDKLDKGFREDNEEVQMEIKAMNEMVLKVAGAPLPRPSVNQAGIMAKGLGPTSTMGIANNVEIPIPTVKSKNPTQPTLDKLFGAMDLRTKTKINRPVMQGRAHEFLSTFLPMFAEKDMRVATQDLILRNELGYPNTSSFGTYAYCNCAHVDHDDSTTCGFVMQRSPSIPRDESNFFWASHRLLVELEHFAFWFWDAPSEHHGTTMNSLALSKPQGYKHLLLDRPEDAQWTRVLVMPTKVVSAFQRKSGTGVET